MLQPMEHGKRIFKIHMARPERILDTVVSAVPFKHLTVIVAPTDKGTILRIIILTKNSHSRLECHALVYIFLSKSCQFCTKLTQLRPLWPNDNGFIFFDL